jgi:hypothetical protein
MLVNPLGPKLRADPARVAQIKRWVVDAFGLDDSAHVMITELRCLEPDCPPIETVIAIMGGPNARRQFKLHSTIAEITHEQISALARTGHDHA